MIYPRNSVQHRDCVLGVCFVLANIGYFPKKDMSPVLKKMWDVFSILHKTLEVVKLSSGAVKDINHACTSAVDAGMSLDYGWPEEQKKRTWAKMWLMGYLAFQDAFNTCPAWVEPWKETWNEAHELIETFTKPLLKKYPREMQEATRVWCCISSPYRHPELNEWLSGDKEWSDQTGTTTLEL